MVALFPARQITSCHQLLSKRPAPSAAEIFLSRPYASHGEYRHAGSRLQRDDAKHQVSREELENRRRFIETVLESIPTGVISLRHDGTIQLVNQALCQIFPAPLVASARRLSDLIPPENECEFSRQLKRARRTGAANRQGTGHAEGARHFGHLTRRGSARHQRLRHGA